MRASTVSCKQLMPTTADVPAIGCAFDILPLPDLNMLAVRVIEAGPLAVRRPLRVVHPLITTSVDIDCTL